MKDTHLKDIGLIISADGWYAVFIDALAVRTRKKLVAWALREEGSGEVRNLQGLVIADEGTRVGFADQYPTFAQYEHEHEKPV